MRCNVALRLNLATSITLLGGTYIYNIPALYTTCIVTKGLLTVLWLYIGTVAHKKSKTGGYLKYGRRRGSQRLIL